MIALNIIIIIQSIFILFLSIILLSRKCCNSAILYYPIFFLIFPFHNILDLINGTPNYKSSIYLLQKAIENEQASLIYFLFVLCMNFVFLFFIFGKKYTFKLSEIKINKASVLCLWGIILLGPLSLFFISEPSIYLIYGDIRHFIGQEQYDEYSFVWITSFFSSICIVTLRFIYGKKISLAKSILLLIILAIDLYINNKRFIYGLIIVYAFISFFYGKNKTLNIFKIILSIIVFSFLYITYSFNYKYEYHQDDSEVYSATRHELSRDDVLRYVIQEKLLDNKEIVEYPGQTYLSIALAFIPRNFWSDKPYPYGQYLTNKVLHNNLGPALGTWTITTSFYDEAIANLGWYGFLFILIFIITMLKLINNIDSLLIKSLLFMILTFYSFTNVNWFLPIIYFVTILLINHTIKKLTIK